jgi:phosphopantothenoylcysteine synthetase/decarboxylase
MVFITGAQESILRDEPGIHRAAHPRTSRLLVGHLRFSEDRLTHNKSHEVRNRIQLMSKAKTVVLGVTGSIAAHKAVDLTSVLTKQGCDVHVVMTGDALKFVTPLPFKTLSRHPVVTDLYDEEEGWKPTHITLADSADLLLIAPATANIISKLACGIADDALTCIALALNSETKLLIAPAMNGKMWQHAATQENVGKLKARGAEFVGPDSGMLSCGYEGVGRLIVVEEIAKRAQQLLT